MAEETVIRNQGATGEDIPDPPAALFSNNPLRWFRLFGPGAVIASVTIGSGELVFSSREGSIFGYSILWIFTLVALLKWGIAYASMRHMILSGGHPFDRWNRVFGPRGWFPLFMFLIFIVCCPVWYSFLGGLLGTACAWIFGIGEPTQWATAGIVIALVMLLLGTYNLLEKVQIVLLSAMLFFMLIAAVWVNPDWLEALLGFVPKWPLRYPDWLLVNYFDEFGNRSIWVEITMATGAIGGASFDYLGMFPSCATSDGAAATWGRPRRSGWRKPPKIPVTPPVCGCARR